jgi:sirohydrochlorin ferrochelatase
LALNSTFLLIAHGSRDPRPHAALGKLVVLFRELLISFVPKASPAIVQAGVLELGPTPLEEQIQAMAQHTRSLGYQRVQLVPLFLLPGVHVTEDIPAAIQAAQKTVPAIELTLCPYLGTHPGLAALISKRLRPLDVDAWVLLAHGSRRPGGNAPVEQLATQLQAHPAYWFAGPDLATQVEALVAAGHQRIGILPYFLFSGTTTDGIAQEVQRLRHQWPGIELRLASPLEAEVELAKLLRDLVQLPVPFPNPTL